MGSLDTTPGNLKPESSTESSSYVVLDFPQDNFILRVPLF